MQSTRKLSWILGAALVIGMASFWACEKDDPADEEVPSARFDRGAMLAHWADNIILPALRAYEESLAELVVAKEDFLMLASTENLSSLRSSWLMAYNQWQKVSMFEVGKAEEIGLRNFTNIYPTDVEEITANILSENYNLALPSNFDAQGFPALDYLLFGSGGQEDEIVDYLSRPAVQRYLSELVDRLANLTSEVLSDWEGSYRDVFVDADGASATASTDKMVNDFLFYYEKFLRAGKVGIPAGVFSGNKISLAVEGRFSEVYSQQLLLTALDALEDFFRGIDAAGTNGLSLEDYLAVVSAANDNQDIAAMVLTQWAEARALAEDLDPNFGDQVKTNNSAMLATYDALQKAVVLLKVDMMQALNIQVDYVDADGD